MPTNRFPTRYARFTDQHGRQYGAVIEGATGAPTGPIDFLHRTPAGNLPPWIPAGKYLVFDPVNQGRLTIDYAQAVADREAEIADWRQLLVKFATASGGTRAIEEIESPSPGMILMIGPKPEGPEIVEAASQGNKWALGFSDAMPSWAVSLMRITDPVRQREPQQYPDAEDEADDRLATPKRSHHKKVTEEAA